VDKLAFPGVFGEPDALPERPDKRFPDGERAAGLFASGMADGRVPSIRAIKSALATGQPTTASYGRSWSL
jgi:hypothetical protein